LRRKRHEPQVTSLLKLRLASAWQAAVTANGYCAVCGTGPKARDQGKRRYVKLDAHHVIPARYLRRFVSAMEMDAEKSETMLLVLLYDRRNGLCICRDCHEHHETAYRRIPRSAVPQQAVKFAREIDREWYIERFYPA
jgi:hypothetical protein